MPPCLTLSPLECSEGVVSSHAANDLALLNLENSPASNTMSAAVMVSTPFKQRSESTLFFQRGFDASASTSLSSLFLSLHGLPGGVYVVREHVVVGLLGKLDRPYPGPVRGGPVLLPLPLGVRLAEDGSRAAAGTSTAAACSASGPRARRLARAPGRAPPRTRRRAPRPPRRCPPTACAPGTPRRCGRSSSCGRPMA